VQRWCGVAALEVGDERGVHVGSVGELFLGQAGLDGGDEILGQLRGDPLTLDPEGTPRETWPVDCVLTIVD
jgi:hypothetical protein